MKNVLIACEESQRVCAAFRNRGFRAFSCDILPCSGGHPEWHIQGDCLSLLNGDVVFQTADTHTHTHNSEISERTIKRVLAMQFFLFFTKAKCKHIAIENPVGIMNTAYRKADQIIDPFMFAESEADTENYVTKRTCLWLFGLPELKQTNDLARPDNKALFGYSPNTGKSYDWTARVNKDRAKERSKTFPGIANAMATQWGDYIDNIADIRDRQAGNP